MKNKDLDPEEVEAISQTIVLVGALIGCIILRNG